MTLGFILSNIGVGICFLLGCMAVVKPKWTAMFVSIKAIGLEGNSEIRATYGGFFVGIAVFAMIVQSAPAFAVIGVGWLTAATVRLACVLTGSYTPKNLGGIVFEAVIGLLCLSACVL